MLRTYGTGPKRFVSTTCHIVCPEPAYGLCGTPIGSIIGEYNAVPSGWTLCEGCYVEVARHRAPSLSTSGAVDAVQQLLEQDLPRARRLRYGADKDDRQPA